MASFGARRPMMVMGLANCTLDRILLEKKRPSGEASVYGIGSYLDTTSPIRPGELVER